jgi:hypothetical protein
MDSRNRRSSRETVGKGEGACRRYGKRFFAVVAVAVAVASVVSVASVASVVACGLVSGRSQTGEVTRILQCDPTLTGCHHPLRFDPTCSDDLPDTT